MIEFLVEVLGEFVFQFVGELLVEFGLQALVAPFRRDSNPWLAALGYALMGSLLGALSLFLLPSHLTPPGLPRKLNLLLTPLVAGAGMAAVGAWRVRRGQPRLRIDRFLYGFLFAASLAAVRFVFAA